MKKATSKIKEVVRTKDYVNTFGTTIYHDLVMENGDKIQIGKKKLQLVGRELSYEIVDTGSEYHQAKAIKPEEVGNHTVTTNTGNPMGIFNKDDKPSLNVQNLIVAQSCISSACNLLQQSQDASSEAVLNVAEKFYKFVMSKG